MFNILPCMPLPAVHSDWFFKTYVVEQPMEDILDASLDLRLSNLKAGSIMQTSLPSSTQSDFVPFHYLIHCSPKLIFPLVVTFLKTGNLEKKKITLLSIKKLEWLYNFLMSSLHLYNASVVPGKFVTPLWSWKSRTKSNLSWILFVISVYF